MRRVRNKKKTTKKDGDDREMDTETHANKMTRRGQ